ncbi:MAG: hypothetical protein R3A44_05665 [Caldilineaceae bacterium]
MKWPLELWLKNRSKSAQAQAVATPYATHRVLHRKVFPMSSRVILLCTTQPARIEALYQIQNVIYGNINEQDLELLSAQLTVVVATSANEIQTYIKIYRNNLVIFYYDGRSEELEKLCEYFEQQSPSLPTLLQQLPRLRLIIFNLGCTPGQIAQFTNEQYAIVGTSRRLQQVISQQFQTRFLELLANGVIIREAYTDAVAYSQIPPSSTQVFYTILECTPTTEQWTLYDEFLDYSPVEDITGGFELDPNGTFENSPNFPPQPFPGTRPYSDEYANLFRGRDIEIGNFLYMITDPNGPKITLMYGQAGVGKTSLLQAGVIPRMRNRYPDWDVLSVTNGPRQRIFESFCREIQARRFAANSSDILIAYLDRSRAQILLCFDGLDQQLGSQNKRERQDLVQFFRLLRDCLELPTRERSATVKILICLRSESIARYEAFLNDIDFLEQSSPRRLEVLPLNPLAIREVVNSISRRVQYLDQYQFQTAPGLAQRIMYDLLTQSPDSSVAPYLQVIMLGLWQYNQRTNRGDEPLSVVEYLTMLAEDRPFENFMQDKFAELRDEFPVLIAARWQDTLLGLPSLYNDNQTRPTDLSSEFPLYQSLLQRFLPRMIDGYLLTQARNEQTRTFRFGHSFLVLAAHNNLFRANRRYEWLSWSLAFIATFLPRLWRYINRLVDVIGDFIYFSSEWIWMNLNVLWQEVRRRLLEWYEGIRNWLQVNGLRLAAGVLLFIVFMLILLTPGVIMRNVVFVRSLNNEPENPKLFLVAAKRATEPNSTQNLRLVPRRRILAIQRRNFN